MRASRRTGNTTPAGQTGVSLAAARRKARRAGPLTAQAGGAARWPALVAAVAAAGALTAACSSGAATAPSSPAGGHSTAAAPASSAPAVAATQAGGKPDSCNVITQAEASAALGGQPVKPPIRGHAYVEGGVACVFYGPNAPAGGSPDIPYADTVRVVLVTGPKAKQYFDDYRSKVSAQSISGLGDAAFYDGYASISVMKGDAYVRIAVGIANNLSVEKTLAADALPRM